MPEAIEIGGPYFEDFVRGQEFDSPGVTLTVGHAAWHQAVTGDRLRLVLDQHVSRIVTGRQEPLAHPMLVANVAIGQSTEPSQRVKGNLFYRGLVFRRPVYIGETLCSTTRVVALRQSQVRPGRPATGLVALEIETRNQDGQQLLHFWRCPLIPCRDPNVQTGWRDDLDGIGKGALQADIGGARPDGWHLDGLAERWGKGRGAQHLQPGTRFNVQACDTITCAPELVRLTLNLAVAHTDSRESYLGRRLVYGGHTLSVAFSQATRALPRLLTILAWESCEHTAPVTEGDRIRTEVTVLDVASASAGATPVKLGIRSFAAGPVENDEERLVIDWVIWVLSL